MLSCFRTHKSKTGEESIFLKNGAAMLEQLIHSFNGNCNPIRLYSVKEIDEATSNFNWDRITHKGSNFALYQGVHVNHEILVKKFEEDSTGIVDSPLYLVTNEVAIASNMSKHKNVLKLLGCCLETELPTLVYEFPAKGNLSDHMYGDKGISIPWQIKLKIAVEVADAISYLHYGMAKMIIHRDIKPGHIFLDQVYVAKLSEFQMSIPIPTGKTYVDVEIKTGTHGFLAPEYFSSGRISDKSDVHNFGILLLELISGTRWSNLLFWDTQIFNEGGASSSSYGQLKCRKPANLCKSFLEANVRIEEEYKMQVEEIGKLVERCLKKDPDERPLMEDVAQALRLIRRS